MFELKIHKPKDKQTWIQAIRYETEVVHIYLIINMNSIPSKNFQYIKFIPIYFVFFRKAVQTCPEDDEEELALSSDEKLVLLHKQNQIKHIVGKFEDFRINLKKHGVIYYHLSLNSSHQIFLMCFCIVFNRFGIGYRR